MTFIRALGIRKGTRLALSFNNLKSIVPDTVLFTDTGVWLYEAIVAVFETATMWYTTSTTDVMECCKFDVFLDIYSVAEFWVRHNYVYL